MCKYNTTGWAAVSHTLNLRFDRENLRRIYAMKNWRKVAALLLALALTVSMAACGGGESSSSTPAADSKTSSAVSTPA